MVVLDAEKSSAAAGLYLFHEDNDALLQPSDVCFSPTGFYVYSRHPVNLYQLLEFTLELPAGDQPAESLTCTCIVAKCRFDGKLGLHQIWMKFLDLPASACSRIHELTKTSETICPYCANS